jgi:hypothetical protein
LPNRKGKYVIFVSAFKLEKGYERVYLTPVGLWSLPWWKWGIPFYVRIYFDNSAARGTNWARALKLRVREPHRSAFVHYDCPKFKTAKGYHEGSFGTGCSSRFSDYKANAKLETVFVTDIDNSFNGRALRFDSPVSPSCSISDQSLLPRDGPPRLRRKKTYPPNSNLRSSSASWRRW